MENSDKKRFWKCMKVLRLSAGQETIDDPRLAKIYFAVLEPYSIDEIENGIIKALSIWQGTKMMPVGFLVDVIKNSGVKIEDRALYIANQILTHLQRAGSRVQPDLKNDPIADQLMKTRWPYYEWASRILESELKWWVKEFCDAYRAIENNQQLQIESKSSNQKLKCLTENLLKGV